MFVEINCVNCNKPLQIECRTEDQVRGLLQLDRYVLHDECAIPSGSTSNEYTFFIMVRNVISEIKAKIT